MWISLTSARAATLRAATRATRAGARARPLPANADFCCERTLAGAAALVMVAIVGRVVKLRFPVGTREVTPPGIGGTPGRVRESVRTRIVSRTMTRESWDRREVEGRFNRIKQGQQVKTGAPNGTG